MPKQSDWFAVHGMVLLQVVAFGSCGLGKKDSSPKSICASSLYPVTQADVPSSVLASANVDSKTGVVVFRSGMLRGDCLSMISSTSSRIVALGISGRAPVASSAWVSEIIFSSSRRLQIKNSTNGTNEALCSTETPRSSLPSSDFKCGSMSYSETLSGPEPSPTATVSGKISGGLWELPWQDIDTARPNYIYALLRSPSTNSTDAMPASLLVTIKVP